jgi:mono/diheme cytochrome c family protein
MYKLLVFVSLCFLLCLGYESYLAEAKTINAYTGIHPGKAVYDENCLTCHQADGMGVPGMNPPLVKTEWVLGDKTRLINIILKGLKTPITINGEQFHNPMPAQNFLTDQQIADVLSYVRSNFGNKASAVKVEEVKKVRAMK